MANKVDAINSKDHTKAADAYEQYKKMLEQSMSGSAYISAAQKTGSIFGNGFA